MTAAILHPDSRSPVERMWAELRFADEALRPADLLRRAGCEGRKAAAPLYAALGRWKAAGLIDAQGRPFGYALTDKGRQMRRPPLSPPPQSLGLSRRGKGTGPRPFRRTGSQRERIWQAMRILPSFDGVELAMAAAANPSVAANLVRELKRAGYLRCCFNQPGRWTKSRPFGLLPPAISREGLGHQTRVVLRDRNTGVEAISIVQQGGRAASLVDGGVS